MICNIYVWLCFAQIFNNALFVCVAVASGLVFDSSLLDMPSAQSALLVVLPPAAKHAKKIIHALAEKDQSVSSTAEAKTERSYGEE